MNQEPPVFNGLPSLETGNWESNSISQAEEKKTWTLIKQGNLQRIVNNVPLET